MPVIPRVVTSQEEDKPMSYKNQSYRSVEEENRLQTGGLADNDLRRASTGGMLLPNEVRSPVPGQSSMRRQSQQDGTGDEKRSLLFDELDQEAASKAPGRDRVVTLYFSDYDTDMQNDKQMCDNHGRPSDPVTVTGVAAVQHVNRTGCLNMESPRIPPRPPPGYMQATNPLSKFSESDSTVNSQLASRPVSAATVFKNSDERLRGRHQSGEKRQQSEQTSGDLQQPHHGLAVSSQPDHKPLDVSQVGVNCKASLPQGAAQPSGDSPSRIQASSATADTACSPPLDATQSVSDVSTASADVTTSGDLPGTVSDERTSRATRVQILQRQLSRIKRELEDLGELDMEVTYV